jgi:serine/threonine protein kinase
MSAEFPADPSDSVSLGRFTEWDVLCDAFEDDWRRGAAPDILTYLERVPVAERSALLEELLPVDWHWRKNAGLNPLPDDYHPLFEQYEPVVRRILAQPTADDSPASRSSKAVGEQRDDDTIRDLPSGHPQSIGNYEILEEIGRGGMGIVYKARDTRLPRLAAIKLIISANTASMEELRRRFHSEAQAAAKLDHPGIVPIYEIGQQDGQPFMALAYVDGQSLADVVEQSLLPPRKAARIMQEVATAVDYAHRRGIIHRDLTPRNILLTANDQPKVTDFGLAKHVGADSSLTAAGDQIGTPSYMPLEQAVSNIAQIGPTSDVYSLGATLYCLLTGRPPFRAATAVETLAQVRQNEPVAPRQLNTAVDRDLETICLKCLQKESHKRYSTAAELADDLGRFLRREPIFARPVGRVERAWRWSRRNPVVASLSSAAALLLMAIAAISTVAYFREAQLVVDKGKLIAEKDRLLIEKSELALKESRARRDIEQNQNDIIAARNEAIAETRLKDATMKRLLRQVYAEQMRQVQAARELGQHSTVRRLLNDLASSETKQLCRAIARSW